MLSNVRMALRLVDGRTRRLLLLCSVTALVVVALEAATFALVVPLGTLLAAGDRDVPSWAQTLGATDHDSALRRLGLLVLACYLLKAAISTVAARLQAKVQARADALLATRLFDSLLSLPYRDHLQRHSAEATVNSNQLVSDVAANTIAGSAGLLTDGGVLLAVFAALVAFTPFVALGLALYFCLVGFVFATVVTPALKRAGRAEQKEAIASNRQLLEGLTGIKAFLANGGTERVSQNFAVTRGRLAKARLTRAFVLRLPQLFLEVSVVLGMVGAAVFLLRSRSDPHALGLLGALVVGSLRVLPSLSRVLGTVNGMRAAENSLHVLTAELALGEAVREAAPPPRPAPFTRELRLESLRFTYPNSEGHALDGIDLSVAAGESVGIVGASGAGKTTLVDVLLGLLEPDSGRILIDDVVLDRDTVASWREQVGYVPQDVFLVDASLADNVRFGRECGDDDVWEALAAAELAAFVTSLPDGLATEVGERGVRLSGGQRQRIGMARALLRAPRVLLLDEATSALDNQTEAALAETIFRLSGQLTTLVIAHRLSTVRRCDRIVLLDGGQVAATGTFDELADRDERFAELVRLGRL